MKVFFDMDGVLADLATGFEIVAGYELSQTLENSMGKEIYWAPIDAARPNFWGGLPKMSDADNLLAFVFSKTSNVHVLSARSKRHEECGDEKRAWILNHTPIVESNINIVLRSEKALFAINDDGTPNILIDDSKSNCKKFRKAGGIAIRHESAESTIEKLLQIL